jgi:hypothetical protein
MSIRTLVEFNHDCAHEISDQPLEFAALLKRFLCSGSNREAEALERYGFRVVSQRHHADTFHIDNKTDGFPAKYYARSKRTGA